MVANPGFNSKQFMLVGKAGEDVTVNAPPGTVCSTDTGVLLGMHKNSPCK